jgi:uncharacterized membrane protein YgcG
VVAKEDRKLRIEVGDGLEGTLTDARCARIIRDTITPRFKAGQFGAGLRAGIEEMQRATKGDAAPAPVQHRTGPPVPEPVGVGGIACVALVLVFFVSILIRHRAARHRLRTSTPRLEPLGAHRFVPRRLGLRRLLRRRLLERRRRWAEASAASAAADASRAAAPREAGDDARARDARPTRRHGPVAGRGVPAAAPPRPLGPARARGAVPGRRRARAGSPTPLPRRPCAR